MVTSEWAKGYRSAVEDILAGLSKPHMAVLSERMPKNDFFWEINDLMCRICDETGIGMGSLPEPPGWITGADYDGGVGQ